MLDRIEPLMITGKKDWFYFGRTRNFKEVYFKDESDTIKNWDIVDVKINKVDRFVLVWELVK
jgi:tRNA A37 methylthiotransferase MiaB